MFWGFRTRKTRTGLLSKQRTGNREADQRLCFRYTDTVQSLYFLNPKFQVSSHLQWLYSPVCVGPGRKPRRPVFSQRGSYTIQAAMNKAADHTCSSSVSHDAARQMQDKRSRRPIIVSRSEIHMIAIITMKS